MILLFSGTFLACNLHRINERSFYKLNCSKKSPKSIRKHSTRRCFGIPCPRAAFIRLCEADGNWWESCHAHHLVSVASELSELSRVGLRALSELSHEKTHDMEHPIKSRISIFVWQITRSGAVMYSCGLAWQPNNSTAFSIHHHWNWWWVLAVLGRVNIFGNGTPKYVLWQSVL